MDGTIRVNVGQAGKEISFPSVNSFFNIVSAMYLGRHKFLDKCDRLHVVFEAVGEFVFQDL